VNRLARLKDLSGGIALLVICGSLWELLSRLGALDAYYFPPVTNIFSALFDMAVQGDLWINLWPTVYRMCAGFVIAVIISLPLGMLMGASAFFRDLFGMAVEFLRPIPSVAIIPIIILLVGIGDSMNIASIAYASTWPLLVNAIEGIASVEALYVSSARLFQIAPARIILTVMLPSALPQILSGMRISLSMALILAVLSEMVVSTKGLGRIILDAQNALDSPAMYAGILVVALLGFLINVGFNRVADLTFPWVERYRGTQA
jgi:NitT/TauT family transport system permease protein